MASKSVSTTAVVLSAVAGNGVVALAKFVGWFLTSSPSMLAEAIHSVADTANQVLLYVGIKHSKAGPSSRYPWGRSNARYLWNLISAMGIFFVGFGVTTYHGVSSLWHGHTPTSGNEVTVLMFILLFALIVEGGILYMAYRRVMRSKGKMSLWSYVLEGDDPTAVAVLLEDSVAVLGVLLAFFGIFVSQLTGSGVADSVASILIGCLLGVMALMLAYANGRLLLGVSARPQEVEAIREFLEEQPTVEKVLILKTHVSGPGTIRVAAEVEFHGGTLIDRVQLERDAEEIREDLSQVVPVLVDSADRMIRMMGKEINRIERALRDRFPQISSVELEVN